MAFPGHESVFKVYFPTNEQVTSQHNKKLIALNGHLSLRLYINFLSVYMKSYKEEF